MGNQNWKETKKECEVNGNGEYIIKKVTLEIEKRKYFGLEKKDIIDLALRIIGLAAIFTPLLLFYLQRTAEIKKQKALFQLEIYSNTTSELHSLLNKSTNSVEYQKSKDKLFFELNPKLALLNDKLVIEKFNEIKQHVNLYTIISNECENIDSLTLYYIWLDAPIAHVSYYTGPLNYKEDSTTFDRNAYMRTQISYLLDGDKARLTRYVDDNKTTSDTTTKYKNLGLSILDNVMKADTNLRGDFSDFMLDYSFYNKSNNNADKEKAKGFGQSMLIKLDKHLRPLRDTIKKIRDNYAFYILKLTNELDDLMIKSNAVLTGE